MVVVSIPTRVEAKTGLLGVGMLLRVEVRGGGWGEYTATYESEEVAERLEGDCQHVIFLIKGKFGECVSHPLGTLDYAEPSALVCLEKFVARLQLSQ